MSQSLNGSFICRHRSMVILHVRIVHLVAFTCPRRSYCLECKYFRSIKKSNFLFDCLCLSITLRLQTCVMLNKSDPFRFAKPPLRRYGEKPKLTHYSGQPQVNQWNEVGPNNAGGYGGKEIVGQCKDQGCMGQNDKSAIVSGHNDDKADMGKYGRKVEEIKEANSSKYKEKAGLDQYEEDYKVGKQEEKLKSGYIGEEPATSQHKEKETTGQPEEEDGIGHNGEALPPVPEGGNEDTFSRSEIAVSPFTISMCRYIVQPFC